MSIRSHGGGEHRDARASAACRWGRLDHSGRVVRRPAGVPRPPHRIASWADIPTLERLLAHGTPSQTISETSNTTSDPDASVRGRTSPSELAVWRHHGPTDLAAAIANRPATRLDRPVDDRIRRCGRRAVLCPESLGHDQRARGEPKPVRRRSLRRDRAGGPERAVGRDLVRHNRIRTALSDHHH